MRGQLRMVVAGVVLVVIGVASIVEPPGVVAGIGFVVVIVAMILVVLQERRKQR